MPYRSNSAEVLKLDALTSKYEVLHTSINSCQNSVHVNFNSRVVSIYNAGFENSEHKAIVVLWLENDKLTLSITCRLGVSSAQYRQVTASTQFFTIQLHSSTQLNLKGKRTDNQAVLPMHSCLNTKDR
jgi:hypothetical protein